MRELTLRLFFTCQLHHTIYLFTLTGQAGPLAWIATCGGSCVMGFVVSALDLELLLVDFIYQNVSQAVCNIGSFFHNDQTFYAVHATSIILSHASKSYTPT